MVGCTHPTSRSVQPTAFRFGRLHRVNHPWCGAQARASLRVRSVRLGMRFNACR